LEAFALPYRAQKKPIPHILILGEDGSGKQTLARSFCGKHGVILKEIAAQSQNSRPHSLPAYYSSTFGNEDTRGVQSFVIVPGLDKLPKQIVGIWHQILSSRPFSCVATALSEKRCAPGILDLFTLKVAMEQYSKGELARIAMLLAWRKGHMRLETGTAEALVSFPGANPQKISNVVDHLSLKLESGHARYGSAGHRIVAYDQVMEALYALGLVSQMAAKAARGPRNNTSRSPTDPPDLRNLSGTEFEKLIASLLQAMGFNATLTKATGDGGIDIQAESTDAITGGRFLFQCKRLATDVGEPQVRDFYGAVSADLTAVKGVFITNSGFTHQARAFASKTRLELIDGPRLAELLLRYRKQAQ
jgi:hypothetical protein